MIAAATQVRFAESLLSSVPTISLLIKLPNFFHSSTITASVIAPRDRRSTLLSSTTVPATVSNGSPVFFVITPHLANSPARGTAKFVMYPILTPSQASLLFILKPRGSIISLHLKARSQNTNMLTNIETAIHLKSVLSNPALKSLQCTPLKDTQSKMPATAKRIKYFRAE